VKLGEWLAEAPFGLAMSSGFFAFYAHTGMLDALVERARPAHVAGSSAGALVGAAWAAGLPPSALANVLAELSRDDFWDPRLGLGLLAGRKFDRLMRGLLPVATFAHCRVPLRISVFDILRRRTKVLTDGDLADAVRASCAVPGLFQPVWIARRPYWDGGILDRPGIAELPAGRVLYHHISGTAAPRRADMVTLVIDGLPRSGPFKLAEGRRALALARAATIRALDQQIDPHNVVQLAA
jgi:NTE family protein